MSAPDAVVHGVTAFRHLFFIGSYSGAGKLMLQWFVFLHCRPVFHAVMKQTLSGYQEIASLSCRDDTNFASPILNFRHIALAYQQYSDNPHLLAEDQHERSCRLRACTKIIGTVISNVMSELEVGSMTSCNHYNDFFTALHVHPIYIPTVLCAVQMYGMMVQFDLNALALQGDMLTVPPDLLDWCQRAANSNPSGVSAFCTEWAHTLQIANHTHAGSHNPFE